MKFVIQRVKNSSCTVDNQVIGEINHGFCVFIGVSNEDSIEIADKMIKKLIGMRIFKDENGKIVTEEYFMYKTIDVKGLIDYFDLNDTGNGTYQIKVYALGDVTVQ